MLEVATVVLLLKTEVNLKWFGRNKISDVCFASYLHLFTILVVRKGQVTVVKLINESCNGLHVVSLFAFA